MSTEKIKVGQVYASTKKRDIAAGRNQRRKVTELISPDEESINEYKHGAAYLELDNGKGSTAVSFNGAGQIRSYRLVTQRELEEDAELAAPCDYCEHSLGTHVEINGRCAESGCDCEGFIEYEPRTPSAFVRDDDGNLPDSSEKLPPFVTSDPDEEITAVPAPGPDVELLYKTEDVNKVTKKDKKKFWKKVKKSNDRIKKEEKKISKAAKKLEEKAKTKKAKKKGRK